MLIKYHVIYLLTTDDFHTRSWHRHIWYFIHHKIIYLIMRNTCNIGHLIYICLHSVKRRMRYNPGKILTHGCKLYMWAWSPFTCNLILVLILRFTLCRHMYIRWPILYVLCTIKYIILWCMKYQMWRRQLRVWKSSVVSK